MNTIYFFAFAISNYAGNRSLYCIDVQVFGGKLVKNSFPHFLVPFRGFHVCLYYLEYHHTAVSEVCKVRPISAYQWNLIFLLPGTWSKVSSTKNISGKEVDLARNLFHKQHIYHQKSINIQQSLDLGCRATLYSEGLINKQEGGFQVLR